MRRRVQRLPVQASAKSIPLTYWELTDACTEKRSAVRCPPVMRGRASEPISAPPLRSASARAAMGRCGSLPLPVNVAFVPSAHATGSRKRSVEPLSPQSNTARSSGCATGVTS